VWTPQRWQCGTRLAAAEIQIWTSLFAYSRVSAGVWLWVTGAHVVLYVALTWEWRQQVSSTSQLWSRGCEPNVVVVDRQDAQSSNLGPETGYPDRFSWVSSSPPRECRGSTFKLSHGCFLPDPSQLFIHSSPYHSPKYISVSQTSGSRGPLHRRSAHTRTTFVKFSTPKRACKWIGETLYRSSELP
jgi:hypothetical protein